MHAASNAGAPEPEPELEGVGYGDARRWMRDMGALLALPALWVDHQPQEITSGLLSVLFSVLQLDGAYARFDDRDVDGGALESWRPERPSMPEEVRLALEAEPGPAPAAGLATRLVDAREFGMFRVTFLPIALPWETGLVIVSSGRALFPTEMETHLLRIAVGQAVIAIRAARRLERERTARADAETALHEQYELLRGLLDEVDPMLGSITAVARRLEKASHLVGEADARRGQRPAGPDRVVPIRAAPTPPPSMPSAEPDGPSPLQPLTRRETEVLGLLAQGLSNKEIAAMMWLSDRTVERHITSLYRKIGVGRRSEATAFALRHGVV